MDHQKNLDSDYIWGAKTGKTSGVMVEKDFI